MVSGSRGVVVALTSIGTLLTSGSALAAQIVVPDQEPTIQAAVDSAAAGDVIHVRSGEYCGATIDKPLTLVGHGDPVIVGCDAPALSGNRRVGFLLPGSQGENPASGTSIHGFTFDGEGVSNTDLEPLALGILARFADDVRVMRNRFEGTVQAITNTGGDGWQIALNRIDDFTVFDCTGFCGGGVGIVLQVATGAIAAPGGAENPDNRPENNAVWGNHVSGVIPDGFDVFGMVGILALAADGSTIKLNKVSVPDNPLADAPGQGILVTNTCCGEDTPLVPGSRDTKVVFNDGRKSEIAVQVEGTDGANTEGLVVFGNRGTVVIEGVEQESRRPRFPRWFSRMRTFR